MLENGVEGEGEGEGGDFFSRITSILPLVRVWEIYKNMPSYAINYA